MGIKRWLEILWWSMKEDWKDSSRKDKISGLIQLIVGFVVMFAIWYVLPMITKGIHL